VARKPAQVEESAAEGCPDWMMTFSDCMTLLLTFFVLLMTFSSRSDQGNYRQDQLSFQDGSISLTDDAVKKTSVVEKEKSLQPNEVKKGSEVPVEAVRQLLSSSRANPKDNESCSKKIFLMSSDDLFYGKSNVLRGEGKSNLRLLGEYIKLVRARVVISENGPGDESGLYGPARALAIMNFLEKECSLQNDRMCISMSGTAPEAHYGKERKAEIALLERSVYK
jgi:hypothetical protein